MSPLLEGAGREGGRRERGGEGEEREGGRERERERRGEGERGKERGGGREGEGEGRERGGRGGKVNEERQKGMENLIHLHDCTPLFFIKHDFTFLEGCWKTQFPEMGFHAV